MRPGDLLFTYVQSRKNKIQQDSTIYKKHPKTKKKSNPIHHRRSFALYCRLLLGAAQLGDCLLLLAADACGRSKPPRRARTHPGGGPRTGSRRRLGRAASCGGVELDGREGAGALQCGLHNRAREAQAAVPARAPGGA